VTPELIRDKVTKHLNVSPEVLTMKTRGTKDVVDVKKKYAHCLWTFTSLTTREIGKLLGKDHTSVINLVHSVRNICKVDKDYRNQIIELENLFDDTQN